jgi:SulP family sulfate permease
MGTFFKASKSSDWIAGMLSGLLIIVIATAYTALIFKESLTVYFSIGISCAVLGSCLINFLAASRSAFPFAIARAEPAPGAILALIFANLASHHLPASTLLPTLLATLSLATFLVGVSMAFIGYFRLGHIIRFLPYPVLGGVITGTAWIMACSSFTLMTNGVVLNAANFFKPAVLEPCLLGLGFALFLLVTPKNKVRSWILVGSLVVTSLALVLFLRFMHISHEEAIKAGWFFAHFKPSFALEGMNPSDFNQIAWSLIAEQAGYLLSFVGIIIIITLLNISSLETLVRGKADLDQELKILGVGNLLSGFFCGASANLSFSGTLLNWNAGATQRFSGILASLICLAVLFFLPEAVSYLPKPLIGGLLLSIALSLIGQWLYTGWRTLPRVDYFIVLFILIMIATWGFLPGVVAGIFITCAVFIVRYTRLDVVKFSATGENLRSNVVRPIYQQKWLATQGHDIQVFKLQGYLFFGSAKLLVDKISLLLEIEAKKRPHFLIFDFQLVNGIDSSASFSFIRLQQLIDSSKMRIVFTGCSPLLSIQLKEQGVIGDASSFRVFPDLDQGLEWCEQALLEILPAELKPDTSVMAGTLDQLIPDPDQQKDFLKYLHKMEIPAHYHLFRQGDRVDCLYFIESGEVSVILEGEHAALRLSKSGAGTIVGEMGFYLHMKRSATVRAETACVLYRLTEEAMAKLEAEHPEIALVFHKSIVRVLALRVVQTNYELEVVSQ